MISYNELLSLVEDGLIDCDPANIRGSSIDVTIAPVLLLEAMGGNMAKVRLGTSDSLPLKRHDMSVDGNHIMMPHTFVLASTVERVKMPLDVSATFALRSSIGRNALNHTLAAHIDPGFEGNITLELTNTSAFAKLILWPGLIIGQLVFHRHDPVPEHMSYAKTGRYNNQDGAQGALGGRKPTTP